MPIAFRESTFSVSWGKLAAKVWGPDDGIPVLALHGWLDNAGSFDRLLPLLPDWRVVAIDFPGHGYSSHRPVGSFYSFLDWATDMTDVIEQLGWRRFSLLGHSLGAAVAGVIAALYPGETERLVLLEAIGPMTSEDAKLPERLALFLSERKKLLGKKPPVYADLADAARARQRVGDLSAEGVQRLVARGTTKVEGGVIWSGDPRLRLPTAHRLNEAQAEALLAQIACPTLLVRASHGMEIPEQVLKSRAGKIRKLRTENVKGNHHVHLDHPERVAPVITSFFSGTLSSIRASV